MLTRNDIITAIETIDYNRMNQEQKTDPDLKNFLENPPTNTCVHLKKLKSPLADMPIYCDISTEAIRPFVPKQFRKPILEKMHGTSHPGIRATTRLVSDRFIWPSLRSSLKTDLNATVAELIYGVPLRLPGEFFVRSEDKRATPEFAIQLKQQMSKIAPKPTSNHHTNGASCKRR